MKKRVGPRPRHRHRPRDHLLRRADHRPRPDHGRRHRRTDRPVVRDLGATALSITHDMASAYAASPTASPCSTTARSSGRARSATIDRIGQSLCRSIHQRQGRGADPDGSGQGVRPAYGAYCSPTVSAVFCLPGLRREALHRKCGAGRCDATPAASWNTSSKEAAPIGRRQARGSRAGRGQRRSRPAGLAGSGRRKNAWSDHRQSGELDRVCGGGLVPGSCPAGRRRSRDRQIDAPAAGRPRVTGRSQGAECVYISGEEAFRPDQALRKPNAGP